MPSSMFLTLSGAKRSRMGAPWPMQHFIAGMPESVR